MAVWDDVASNLRAGVSSNMASVTSAWDSLTNLDTLSMPKFKINDMLKSTATVVNSLSGAATNDNKITGSVLKGIEQIRNNHNDGLSSYASKYTNNDGKIGAAAAAAEEVGDEVSDLQKGLTDNRQYDAVVDTTDADRLSFDIPDWGYADFINDRAIFQKSLQNPLGERGWFYFKIFFNFDTQYGLFGGLLNNPDPLMATNTAYKYLHSCEALGSYYKCSDRQVALMKFTKILSYISTHAPWFFSAVKGLDQANIPVINDLTKDRFIEIECSPDAIDMRLNMLMDLYKFACYDEIDQKEIVPDNLRKFDMTIMLFQSPIKYFHTSFKTKDNIYPYKNLSVNNKTGFADTMSFKMFTFINCEIALDSLGSMVPSNVNNEKAFELGKGTIKIQYDRVYTHTMNEFMHIMFGNDGLYYDGSKSTEGLQKEQSQIYEGQKKAQLSRTNDIRKIYTQKIPDHNDKEMEFKNIVDASEALCTNNMKSLGFNALGNYAGVPNDPQINIGTSPIKLTEFYDLKLKMLKNDIGLNDVLANMPGNTGKMIGRLIEEYNNRRSVIRAQWPESRKNITTDKWGHMIAMTQAQQAGNLYWITKLAQMKDGYVVPEVGPGNMPGQLYNYSNFTSGGYGDNIMTSDANGNLTNSKGTNYWMNKIRKLKEGTIDKQSPTVNIRHIQTKANVNDAVSSQALSNKLIDLSTGTIRFNAPQINVSVGGDIRNEGDIHSNELQNKIHTLKDGVIDSDMPQVNVEIGGDIKNEGDIHANELQDKIHALKDGVIDSDMPQVNVEIGGDIKNDGDPYSGEYMDNKLHDVKNGTIKKTGNQHAGQYLNDKLEQLKTGTIMNNGDPYSGEYFNQKLDKMNDRNVDPWNSVTNSEKHSN